MLFHSLLFIYLFLPVTLFFFYISRKGLRNIILLLASLAFSGWFQISLTLVLVGSITLNYFAGIAIGHAATEKKKRFFFILAIVVNLVLLGLFKYLGFLGNTVSDLVSMAGLDPFVVKEFGMPLGISFYTFKALSYLISVKRQEVPAQKSYIDLALYIAIFPQLVAGPIDRYRNLAPQLADPSASFARFSSGVKRFVLGLVKKVIIATPLALAADRIFESPVAGLNAPLAWLGAICYTLQIYYDFAGYTDMALGVGKMFGLEFTENFNFPYTARSFRDFWKRWHISLSSWLRDYLFLPLAYARSKKMVKEKYLHLKTDNWIYLYATSITFLLCGLWHGAAWTFVIWGLFHGMMMIVEQFGFGKILKKSFRPLQHLYLLFFLVLTWVLFRSPSVRDAALYIGAMFGAGGQPENLSLVSEYLNIRTIFVLTIGILGATRFFDYLLIYFKSTMESNIGFVRAAGTHVYYISGIIFVLLTLAFTTVFILAGTSTPFIYFKF
jgi:alginate O-acetyltransferase complex protein AlgI